MVPWGTYKGYLSGEVTLSGPEERPRSAREMLGLRHCLRRSWYDREACKTVRPARDGQRRGEIAERS